jgi:hypothetical protein
MAPQQTIGMIHNTTYSTPAAAASYKLIKIKLGHSW